MSESTIGRRGFVVTRLSAGFSRAVTPVSADTITTSADGLEAGEVKIPVGDGEIPAYRAMPKKGQAFPVVLVIHEIFGVHEHIKDICRRFAKLGYLAVAPELYARQGDVSQIADIKEIVEQVVSKVPDAQVMGDLDATIAWAGKNGGDGARVGIIGFCWGGRIVWLYSAHNPFLRAGAAFYGRLVGKGGDALRPKEPIDVAPTLKVSVLGLYGGADEGIPQETVEQMKKALPAVPKSEIVVYARAPHGFFADYRGTYRKEVAEDAWKRVLRWFKDRGV